MRAEIPVGSQAVRAWKSLDPGVRKDVIRRSRKNMGYPDPVVAAIAIGRARYTLSLSLWYWVRHFGVITIILLGLAAMLDRMTTLDDNLYLTVITASLSSGIMRYREVRRDAEQLEWANLKTFTADRTDHGSVD